MSLREKISYQKYRTWTRAYDSYQKRHILVRRINKDPRTEWNDRWMIKDPLQVIYSFPGCLPLYITIIE